MSKKRYTVTSALPYANGPLHIGHIAGAYLPADIFVRYKKAKGDDVVFICGSDEHGAAITLQAKKENKSPKDIVDKYHTLNKKSFKEFGINFDAYHRTSSELHHKTASDFFSVLYEKGVFTKKTTQQFFDEKHKQFLADRYISGGCPKCGYENAYGDQCEKCGSSLSPQDLINPVSTLSGTKPVLKETFHWFLPMQNHEKWLFSWIENGMLEGRPHHDPKKWKPQVLGQCKSWLDAGLQERAMTRDLSWGVKVPLKDANGKVLYVWLDAPIGYISATKQWALDNNKNWEDYWVGDNVELIHFIGKDNIVFHCIIFPIILKEHGGFCLPTNVPSNEFLNLEGNKFSTSRNWAIWLHEYLSDFPEKQDVLRYALCASAPETKDSDFSWSDFQSRNNNELVAVFGNFINRAVVLTHKYWGGKTPLLNSLNEYDKTVFNKNQKAASLIGEKIELFKFRDALTELMSLARLGNKYLADTEPWKIVKENETRAQTILHVALQIAANLAVLSHPFLPNTAKKLSLMLNINESSWNATNNSLLKEGHMINKASLLFEKIEDSDIELQLNKLNS